MATTRSEKAAHRALLKGRKEGKVREEKHILTFLLVVIAILLYLLMARSWGWWPYTHAKLGTAFYTNVSSGTTPVDSGTSSSGSSTAGSSTSSSHTSGTGSGTQSDGSGTSGSGNGSSGGSSSSSSPASTPIANFAAQVDVGDTKAQTSAQANGLGQNCAVLANTSLPSAGQQQVCTYTEGNKIVTVTYLNDHVISASKSGF